MDYLRGFTEKIAYFRAVIQKHKDMEAAIMKKPETIALTYDKANPFAKKTLNFLLSLEIFQVKTMNKSQIEIGLDEYRQGKYTVINKGKKKI